MTLYQIRDLIIYVCMSNSIQGIPTNIRDGEGAIHLVKLEYREII